MSAPDLSAPEGPLSPSPMGSGNSVPAAQTGATQAAGTVFSLCAANITRITHGQYERMSSQDKARYWVLLRAHWSEDGQEARDAQLDADEDRRGDHR